MGKFDGYLFCTDLDGTLLNSKGVVSEENRRAIEYFKSEGGLFTFITGRMPYTSVELVRMVCPNAPIGCINGGGIYDFKQNKYLWQNFLPESALDVIDFIYDNMAYIGIQLNCSERIYFTRTNDAMELFRKSTNVPYIYGHHREINEPISKVFLASTDIKKIEQMRRQIEAQPFFEDYDFISSSADSYEILPKGNSKGSVFVKMAELLGIDMRNTIAVGDFENDVSMIKAAGIGYAVSNADPRAKAVADRITVSNDEHAIATIISEL